MTDSLRIIHRHIFYVVLGIFLFTITLTFLPEDIKSQILRWIHPPSPQSIFQSPQLPEHYRFIAHGLGGIDDTALTNSREAFLLNYQKGFRLFEIDLMFTQDKQIIALHNGFEPNLMLSKNINDLPASDVQHKKFNEKYTLLTFKDILDLLEQHPDAYLILDIKENFKEMMGVIVQQIHARDARLLNQIIPQIYNKNDLQSIQKLDAFPDTILTLYRTEMSDDEVVRMVGDARITAVAMSWNKRYNVRLRDRLQKLHVAVFVHTLNESKKIEYFLDHDVGVYSDFFDPSL